MPRYLFRYVEYVPFASDFIIVAENKGEAQAKARRGIDDGVYIRLWKRGFMEPNKDYPVGKRTVTLDREVQTDYNLFNPDFAPELRIKDE